MWYHLIVFYLHADPWQQKLPLCCFVLVDFYLSYTSNAWKPQILASAFTPRFARATASRWSLVLFSNGTTKPSAKAQNLLRNDLIWVVIKSSMGYSHLHFTDPDTTDTTGKASLGSHLYITTQQSDTWSQMALQISSCQLVAQLNLDPWGQKFKTFITSQAVPELVFRGHGICSVFLFIYVVVYRDYKPEDLW